MRKPNVTRVLSWRNPLNDQSLKPYLDSPIFPGARGTPDDRKAREILQRFYTTERHSDEDIKKLQRFVRQPDKPALVLWGDIGIGKTSFLRYHLDDLQDRHRGTFYYGIIDMLRASTQDARERLEKQLVDILEEYFRDTLGGLRKGLRPYAEYKARALVGNEEGDELRIETGRILEEVLNSKNPDRADHLLDALEIAPGPPLFIAVDNVDRAIGSDQHIISDLAARRLRCSKIFLIFSLRISSRILLDDSQILSFFEKAEMSLSPVSFPALLRQRFARAKHGEDLRTMRVSLASRSDDGTTFPDLLEGFLDSDAGQFVLELAGTNSRKLLDFISRVFYSNQLGNIRNLQVPEACIAALLMLDQAKFFPELSYILNMFDNEESSAAGNALIRFRTLEYLGQIDDEISTQERRFTDYFESLGYLHRVKDVIATFVGAGIAQTNPLRTAENIRKTDLSAIGQVGLIKSNASQYFEKLFKSPWYFICVKSDICIDEHLIRRGKDGEEYVSDVDFIEFLKSEEDKERRRLDDWIRRHGQRNTTVNPIQSWALARAALEKRDKMQRARETAIGGGGNA